VSVAVEGGEAVLSSAATVLTPPTEGETEVESSEAESTPDEATRRKWKKAFRAVSAVHRFRDAGASANSRPPLHRSSSRRRMSRSASGNRLNEETSETKRLTFKAGVRGVIASNRFRAALKSRGGGADVSGGGGGGGTGTNNSSFMGRLARSRTFALREATTRREALRRLRQGALALLLAVVVPLLICRQARLWSLLEALRSMEASVMAFSHGHVIDIPSCDGSVVTTLDYARTDATLMDFQNGLRALHAGFGDGGSGGGALGLAVRTIDGSSFEFESSASSASSVAKDPEQSPSSTVAATAKRGHRKGAADKTPDITMIVLAYLALAAAAYVTKHEYLAAATLVMDLALLWTTYRVLRLDDAIRDHADTLISAQLRLAEVPLGEGASAAAQGVLLHKLEAFSKYWQTQSLGLALEVPMVGSVTLSATGMVSLLLASLPSLYELLTRLPSALLPGLRIAGREGGSAGMRLARKAGANLASAAAAAAAVARSDSSEALSAALTTTVSMDPKND